MDSVGLANTVYRETAAELTLAAPLEGAHRIDFAVVGAGITGLSTALHLAEAGHQVAVLEAHEPGWGASGRNGGQLNPGLKYDPDDIVRQFGAALGTRMVEFGWSSTEFTLALIQRLGIDCDARQNGTLRAAPNAHAGRSINRTLEQSARWGMPVEALGPAAMAELTGTDRYGCGLLDRRGGDLNPLKYVRGLAHAVANAGGHIFPHSQALSLKRLGDGWDIRTGGGRVLASQVLIATNGYTGALWPGLAQSLVPVYSAIAATEPLPPALAAGILPGRQVAFETGRITVYYRIDSQGRLLMGGRGPMRPIHSPAPLDNLTGYARALWPQLSHVQWTHGWNGQVAITPDHHLHVHEPAPGLTACVGYNGRGVALATAMGKVLAEHMAGADRDQFPMPFSPIKPMRFHRFWPVGVQLAIVSGRVKDRLGF
ncbi:NAD(P)/FAD-dependent oxidoreductase [Pseudomonas typographi]|uniref:FAD-binding oxidoreductase n=1 Tax=Pseudomonas typographi TaxID=2715964 RepID=A0ABR7Z6Z5_9PSED|nr:FAD-binding oxidoreductase [Pseudomonas typographi]MBD1586342.1 FAD-binding oxidoreductase [Pseudomonas typographi]MBD1601301.1 FAD-binding oxidoreductase [Pseudomonas typographi]